jgi:hypothetical protein
MRILGLAFCLIVVGLAGAASAQSLTDGPLSAPGANEPVPAKAHAPKGHKAAAKTTHHKEAKASRPLPDPPEPAVPVAAKRPSGEPTDPLSLGMKWNGSNDNAEKTRIQNYGGDAAGTGAAVGLNYHF